ncbi:MAG: hydrogenase maturation nickel metallochaperone HypA [Deltaproteobacteria bacterium]|nr:hydrogenase maturation nickel metallochaperone HypA [Deltaproteobacteria bacterium]
MHEFSIAQSIVQILQDQMRIHGLSKIETVRLRIGAMRSVQTDSLSFSFDVLTAGSPLEGARLQIEEVPMGGRCTECGKRFTLNNWTDDCPFCGAALIEIVSGKELDIVAVEGD